MHSAIDKLLHGRGSYVYTTIAIHAVKQTIYTPVKPYLCSVNIAKLLKLIQVSAWSLQKHNFFVGLKPVKPH